MSHCTSYVFDVPGTPRTKGRPRVTARGTYTPKLTKVWERAVGMSALVAGLRPCAGPVRVDVWLLGVLAGDVDNYCKAILDGLNGVAYADDAQVVQLAAHMVRGRGELCRVRVVRLEAGWEQAVEMPEVGREA
jgi:crossover junction endodeoxyribonuclease RusA